MNSTFLQEDHFTVLKRVAKVMMRTEIQNAWVYWGNTSSRLIYQLKNQKNYVRLHRIQARRLKDWLLFARFWAYVHLWTRITLVAPLSVHDINGIGTLSLWSISFLSGLILCPCSFSTQGKPDHRALQKAPHDILRTSPLPPFIFLKRAPKPWRKKGQLPSEV